MAFHSRVVSASRGRDEDRTHLSTFLPRETTRESQINTLWKINDST
jgi:hypothetical protein